MNFQATARRAEAAHHVGRVIGLKPSGYLAEAEVARMQHEVLRELAIPLAKQGVAFFYDRMLPQFCNRLSHDAIPPGILSGITAVKNR